MWWARYDTLMITQYSRARFPKKETSFPIIIGSIFAFFIRLIYQDPIPLAALLALAGSCVGLSEKDIPFSGPSDQQPKYSK